MSVEYLKMLNLLFREERARHRTVELPWGTVRIEDTMTKEWTHKPVKPLPYGTAQSHCARQRRYKQTFPKLLEVRRQYHL